MCTFWLVEQYANAGRLEEAEELMATMVGTASDLGLLAEEDDPDSGRLAGNFPQAFSHLGLIRAADAIAERSRPWRPPASPPPTSTSPPPQCCPTCRAP